MATETATVQATADADAAAQAAAVAASSDAAATTATATKTEAGAAATPEPVVVAPVVPVVPETYDLKLPDGSTLDPAIVERTAALARDLGLSNEAGQKLLDQTVQAETTRATEQQAFIDSWKPGGDNWTKRNADWETQAKADPELGKTPEAFAQSIEKGQQALAKYDEGKELKAYLDATGIGSHPAAIKFLARIGRAMSEGAVVMGTPASAAKPKTDAQILYPNMYNEDGSPKT